MKIINKGLQILWDGLKEAVRDYHKDNEKYTENRRLAYLIREINIRRSLKIPREYWDFAPEEEINNALVYMDRNS